MYVTNTKAEIEGSLSNFISLTKSIYIIREYLYTKLRGKENQAQTTRLQAWELSYLVNIWYKQRSNDNKVYLTPVRRGVLAATVDLGLAKFTSR